MRALVGSTGPGTSIAGDDLVVPDIAGPALAVDANRSFAARAVDPVAAALAHGESVLEELCSTGLAAKAPGALARVAAAAQRFDDAGLADMAARFRALEGATRGGRGAADAWIDAGVRLALSRRS